MPYLDTRLDLPLDMVQRETKNEGGRGGDLPFEPRWNTWFDEYDDPEEISVQTWGEKAIYNASAYNLETTVSEPTVETIDGKDYASFEVKTQLTNVKFPDGTKLKTKHPDAGDFELYTVDGGEDEAPIRALRRVDAEDLVDDPHPQWSLDEGTATGRRLFPLEEENVYFLLRVTQYKGRNAYWHRPSI